MIKEVIYMIKYICPICFRVINECDFEKHRLEEEIVINTLKKANPQWSEPEGNYTKYIQLLSNYNGFKGWLI